MRGKGREQCPAFVSHPVRVAADRHEVIEQPCVLNLRDGAGLAPDPQDVVVVDLRGSGHDPEAGSERLRHGTVSPFNVGSAG
jgi:hypothetical protein